MNRIYLDTNATTALDPLVLAAMREDLSFVPANPSSIHSFGRAAKKRLNEARESLAKFFQVKPKELIFTSGGTEGINMILKGFFSNLSEGHLITTEMEHAALFETAKLLEKRGVRVTYLKGSPRGAVSLEEVEAAILPKTRMLALSAANSETGVKIEMEALASLAQSKGIFFFVDGVALLGKELFTIPEGVSAMAFSGHKIHAPKGIGLAFLRSPHKLEPLLFGGGQEGGMRSGTENLAGIVGFSKAVELLTDHLPSASLQMGNLRDSFEREIKKKYPDAAINGEGKRVPNTSNLFFPNIHAEELLMNLDLHGVAASHGSACSSGAFEPSRILLNMDLSHKRAASSLRFSLSRFTTKEEIEKTLMILSEILS